MIDLTAKHPEEALDDFSKAIELCNSLEVALYYDNIGISLYTSRID